MKSEKSPEARFREMVKDDFMPSGVWCPMCEDYIVRPDEEVNSLTVEDMVFDHYEGFHTAEEIEKYIGGRNEG